MSGCQYGSGFKFGFTIEAVLSGQSSACPASVDDQITGQAVQQCNAQCATSSDYNGFCPCTLTRCPWLDKSHPPPCGDAPMLNVRLWNRDR